MLHKFPVCYILIAGLFQGEVALLLIKTLVLQCSSCSRILHKINWNGLQNRTKHGINDRETTWNTKLRTRLDKDILLVTDRTPRILAAEGLGRPAREYDLQSSETKNGKLNKFPFLIATAHFFLTIWIRGFGVVAA